MDTAIQQLIDMLKTASPVVWATLVRQAQVEGYAKIAWAVVALVICVVSYRFMMFVHIKISTDNYDGDESDWTSVMVFCGAASLVSALAMVAQLIMAAMRLINPEFYAIRYLIESIR